MLGVNSLGTSAGKDNAKTDTEAENPEKTLPLDRDGNIDHSALDPGDAETYFTARTVLLRGGLVARRGKSSCGPMAFF